MVKQSAFDISGRNAVVTGGGKGLGFNLARILSSAGARVLISGRDETVLRQAAAELSEAAREPVRFLAADLSDRRSLATFAERVELELGGVDIFVANAAMEHQTHVDAVDEHVMDRLFETNIAANIMLTSAFAKGMKARRWGRFIFISSNAASVAGHWGHGVYSASKAALEAYARCAAVELGPFGITANAIAPGTYITGMVEDRWREMGEPAARESQDALARMNALGRWGEPAEMEGALLLLASDAGSFITGTTMAVDGGLTIKMVPS